MNQPRGVYFLANDHVLELAIAFLNSFRSHNPHITLCCVPFDGNVTELMHLSSVHGFTMFDDNQLLILADAISVEFHGRALGQYRKLVMWEGAFDEFVYIDVDTVLLNNIDFSFDYLRDYDFIAAHSNDERYRRWVWKETVFTHSKLAKEQIEFAASTGFMVSRRGVLSMARMLERLPDALALAPHMELLCAEQPLLNYLMVTMGRYTSLLTISQQLDKVSTQVPVECPGGYHRQETLPNAFPEHARIPRPLFIHWAGIWREAQHTRSPIWQYYRNIRKQE